MNANSLSSKDVIGLISKGFLDRPIESALRDAAKEQGVFLSKNLTKEIRKEMTENEFSKLRNNDISDEIKLDVMRDISERIEAKPDVDTAPKKELGKLCRELERVIGQDVSLLIPFLESSVPALSLNTSGLSTVCP